MSWLKAYAVAITSLLAGAAVVHNIYKPDLVSVCRQPQMWPSGPDLHFSDEFMLVPCRHFQSWMTSRQRSIVAAKQTAYSLE